MGNDSADETVAEGLLCIICSSLTSDNEGGSGCTAGTGLTNNAQFSRFCGELEVCDKNEGVSDKTDKSVFTAINFLRTLERSADYYCMCAECLQLISESMETRVQIEEAEYQVLELQIQLLHKLKALQQCTDLYFQELFRIFERVRTAEVSSVERRQSKMHKELGKRHVHHYTKCDVLQFREKIMDVVTHLGIFQDDLHKKLMEDAKECEEDSVINQLNASPNGKIPESHRKPRLCVKPLPPMLVDDDDDANDNLDDCDWDDDEAGDELQQESSELPPPIKEEAVENIEEDREDDHKDTSDHNEATKGINKGNPKKRADGKKKRKSPVVKTAAIKRKALNTSHRGGLRVPRGAQENPKLLLVDFTNMGPLKKHFILRILNCSLLVSHTTPSTSTSGGEAPSVMDKDKDLTQLHVWDYDPPTDRVTLSGRDVNLEENEELQELTLGCTACDYRYHYSFMTTDDNKKPGRVISGGMNILQRNVFDHIVGEHLNGFQCPQCYQTMVSHKTFQDHIKTHGLEKKFTCDQCGASFHKKWGFRRHLVVHLSGEERQEAYNKFRVSGITGQPFPSASKSRKKPDKYEYQCTTCGKKFWKFQHLQIHEESHKSKDSRPMIVCPLCGIQILMVSYSKHKKNYCSAIREKQAPPVCDICGKAFKTQRYLSEHRVRRHTDSNFQMPFQCGDCECRFKLKKDLRQHELHVHKRRKELECGKGCGKKFVFEISLQKHEEKCQKEVGGASEIGD